MTKIKLPVIDKAKIEIDCGWSTTQKRVYIASCVIITGAIVAVFIYDLTHGYPVKN